MGAGGGRGKARRGGIAAASPLTREGRRERRGDYGRGCFYDANRGFGSTAPRI
jgi:hypothetical protein